jgi:hypothetical protein
MAASAVASRIFFARLIEYNGRALIPRWVPSEKGGRDLVGDRLNTHNAEVGPIHLVGGVLENFLR